VFRLGQFVRGFELALALRLALGLFELGPLLRSGENSCSSTSARSMRIAHSSAPAARRETARLDRLLAVPFLRGLGEIAMQP
jgi:hypothetical protein